MENEELIPDYPSADVEIVGTSMEIPLFLVG